MTFGGGGPSSASNSSPRAPNASTFTPKAPSSPNRWVITGAAAGAAAGAATSSAASPKPESAQAHHEQNLLGDRSSLKEGQNVTVNKDGSKTVRTVKEGRLTEVENVLPSGQTREKVKINADGSREHHYPQSNKTAKFDSFGQGVVKSPFGAEKKVSCNDSGVCRSTNVYQDRKGQRYSSEYVTRDRRIGDRYVPAYVPSTPVYSNDNFWFYMWLLNSNHSSSSANNYGGYYGGSGGAGSLITPSNPSPRDVQIPKRVAVEWASHFETVPDFYKGVFEYESPNEIIRDYVILEVIQENSDQRPSWFTRLFNRLSSFGTHNGTENLKVYQMEAQIRQQLGRQIAEIAARVSSQQDIDLSGLFDVQTGKLQKNENGTTKSVLFVVDRGNIQKVYDAQTNVTCTLQAGSVLVPVSVAEGTEQHLVEARLLSGGTEEGDCKAGRQVLTTIEDLQEMNNDLAQKVERALRTVPRMVRK